MKLRGVAARDRCRVDRPAIRARGAAVGAGITVGPLAGAGLAAALGWRSGFWVEAAAAGVVMIAATTLTESPATTRRELDLPGIATLGAGMALLTAALVEARHGWSGSTTLLLLGAAALMLAAFAAIEFTRRRPMLDPRLFAEPQWSATSMVVALTARSLPGQLRAKTRLVIGLALAAAARQRLPVSPPEQAGPGSCLG